ncbi:MULTISPECIES: carboxymuconolactone decarboxylase family protein [unclassified Chelatococcus]|uniref:carboxymuconolactone decarboxylase family protein n=1 Tax=unclassified Chelatococcus TaxID=2638111 RepID=UPI001BCCF876|nr:MULTISPECIES: carboxymuconolactone decarboxylase family protein [unclassified Chelatococcus]MBS7699697.1 carboxymuconolactone decarboxylase family protein [Chelatococcus sp. YT9]MBX3557105.1 carboxymuconolactone decarboxylase family protein [Chelatococcus sp.]
MLIGVRDVAEMTPRQREVHDAIASGPRAGVPLPFLAMLDVPELAHAIQSVGAAIRFSGALAPALREIAILATAAAFGSGYEWDYHLPIARDLGVPEATIAAAASGRPADAATPEYQVIIALCRDAVLNCKVNQDSLRDLVGLVGSPAASEVVAIAGYYKLLALFLAAGALDHGIADP